MSISVKRTRIFGIAREVSGYGVAALAPTFVMPALEFDFTPEITQPENTAMVGSVYEVNDVINDIRKTTFSGSIKVNEDQFPLFLAQTYTISSTVAAGETVVYKHTLNFANQNDGASFTIFIEDANRGSWKLTGAKFSSINIVPEKGQYLKLDIEGMAVFPQDWSGTHSLSYINEFASADLAMYTGTEGDSGSLAAYNINSATFNHNFELTDDEDNFYIGDEDMRQLLTKSSSVEVEITAPYSDQTIFDQYKDGTYRYGRVIITDVDRYVTGSAANTNPKIQIDYPSMRVMAWNEEGGASDILKQTFTLKALDKLGVSNTPMQIVVTNAIASY